MPKKAKRPHPEPADFSRLMGGQWDLPRCFIIHAWSPDYIKLVIKVLGNSLRYRFHVDVDFNFGKGESISAQALEAIRRASLVVAILDDLPPNVVFETGYALALGKPIIPLACNGAKVNVARYFPEGACPAGLANPDLDFNKHFSDIRDLNRCPYDHGEPESPVKAVADALAKPPERPLARRVLETWAAMLRDIMGESDASKHLERYICCDASIKALQIGPLFATRRQKEFKKRFAAAMDSKARAAASKAKRLDPAVLEALGDLPPDVGISAVRRLLKSFSSDRNLLFLEAYLLCRIAESCKFEDEKANEEALRACERFLRKYPDTAEAHNNFALLLAALKRPEEAEKHYRRALEVKEDDVEAHNNFALLLAALKRPEEAERHYLRALEIKEDDAGAHNNYALLLAALKRPEEAERHYLRALEIKEDDAEAHANLGRLYQDQGRRTDARRCYERALEIGGLPDGGERVRKWLSELGESGDEERPGPS